MDIREKAMLVSVNISTWTGRSKDANVSEEVSNEKLAEKDTGVWWTYLVPKKDIIAVGRTAAQLRNIVNKNTLPWMDGGTRVLPSAMFMKFREVTAPKIAEFNKEIDLFLERYPEIVAKAQERLGNLYVDKFPSVEELRRKFAIEIRILPMPAISDFRIDLGKESEGIQSKMAKDIENLSKLAIKELWEQLTTMVDKIATTMADPDKRFKDATIENLASFIDNLPNMNFTEDENLEEIRLITKKKLAGLKPDDLRDNPVSRSSAADEAKKILAKIKQYGAK